MNKSGRFQRLSSIVPLVLLGSVPVCGLFAQDTLELRVANATVPPAGTLQFQLAPTTPKPIVKGRQGMVAGLSSMPIIGSLQGGALFSKAGDASGFALVKGNSVQVSFNSSEADLGEELDKPTLVLVFPVAATATVGETAPLTLSASNSVWVDPVTGGDYTVIVKPGTMTVGGSLSIASVNPGGGPIPAGTKIVIKGTGFQQGLQVKLLEQEVKISSTTVVSSSEVDIVLRGPANLTGVGIMIRNPGNESVTYYSFQRTVPFGASTNSLLRAALPMFGSASYSAAYFHPILSKTTFSGIALQNTGSATATVDLQLTSGSELLGTASVTLGSDRYVVRDIAELFPAVTMPASGSTLQATTPAGSVQMLGLLADSSANTVTPVDPLLMP